MSQSQESEQRHQVNRAARGKTLLKEAPLQVLSVSVPDVRYFAALLRGVNFVAVSERAPAPSGKH